MLCNFYDRRGETVWDEPPGFNAGRARRGMIELATAEKAKKKKTPTKKKKKKKMKDWVKHTKRKKRSLEERTLSRSGSSQEYPGSMRDMFRLGT